MDVIRNFANFIKFEHTLFSLPLIFAGAFLAWGGIPELHLIVLIILAGTGARTAALALNRIIDRKMDSLNPRTEGRELPSGKISLFSALGITAAGLILYFVSAYFICELVFYLSPIPIIVFIVYPLMKRFTPLCHFGVGLGLALAPLGGWVAVTCSLSRIFPGIMLSLFTFFWVSGFDIIYATLDEEFDRKSGVRSMVSVYGKETGLYIAGLLHYAAFFCIAFIYFFMFKTIAAGALLAVIGFLLYLEHKKSENVDLAFFKINIAAGLAVFLFILSGIYLP
ncbi:MAG: putative 4-hydroxybenzoate polyprenyltransferase [Candidatus Dadabacteria bacterium]|nr:putative 4-hydroxybenzoate polyprenyltransferase [Candidatus Dadabacteria bacterium]